MQQGRMLFWARNFYLVGLVLSLLIIVPNTWFPLALTKLALFAIFAFIASVAFVAGGGMQTVLRGRGTMLALSLALLPIAYLLSLYFSSDTSVGLLGYSVEPDTVVFVSLAFIAFFLSFGLFRGVWSASVLLASVAWVGIIAAAFQTLLILFGSNIPGLAVFSDHSTNLIGKWNDLGVLLGFLLLLGASRMAFSRLSLPRTVLMIVLAIPLMLLLAIIQFSLVWTFLLCFSLLLAFIAFIRTPQENASVRGVPWAPLCVVIVSTLFLLWGVTLGSTLTTAFPVSSLEVRPSFESTLSVIRASHGDSAKAFLFGTGPETFSEQWMLNKPASVNQSQFWNLDFNIGFSTVMSAILSVGVLGLLAWFLPLVVVLIGLFRALRSSAFSPNEKTIALILGAASVYLFCAALLYAPSGDMLLLMFTMCGATFGFCMKDAASEDTGFALAPAARFLSILLAIVLILLSLTVGVFTGRRFVSEAYTNEAGYVLGQNDSDTALTLASRAQTIEVTGDDLRVSADAGLAKLKAIAATPATATSTQILQAQFTSQLQQTIPLAKQATVVTPKDYRAYLSLASVYDFLSALSITGALDNARQTYGQASELDPMNPQIYLSVARMDATVGSTTAAQQALSQALTLKPDYTDAILFAVQFDVANHDISNAIVAAKSAVASAPGVQALWFELGLLYYSSNDTADAIPALEQAVQLEPDYANAKYFLGLSYAAQGRNADALQQFKDLLQTNPDNGEVQLILSNLQAGKSPFDNAEPPITPSPQSRPTAPISQ